MGEVWALALAWKTYQVRTQSFEVTSQIISQVIVDMALRSVGVSASMYQNQLNQLTRMEKSKRGNTPPKRTNGAIPKLKTKGPIINALVPLIRQVTNDIDLQYFLISLYDDTSNDQYTVDLFSGQTYEQEIGRASCRERV